MMISSGKYALSLIGCALLAVAWNALAQQQERIEDIEDLFERMPKSAEAACIRYQCRQATLVRLRKDEAHEWQVEIPRTPYVRDGMVSVLPGERTRLAAKPRSKILVDVQRTVADTDEPIIELYLEQDSASVSGVGMRLDVTNPFDRPLGFEAAMFAPDYGTQYIEAETCLVGAKSSATIRWPVPVFELRIFDFHFAEPDERRACDAAQ